MTISVLLNNEHNIVREQGLTKTTAELQVIHTGVQATIILGEKLVVTNIQDLRSEFKRLIGAGVKNLLLNCARLSVLDSTGIGCLVAAHNSLSKEISCPKRSR